MVGAPGRGRVDADEPADRGMTRIHVVPVGIVGLLAGLDGAHEADALEGEVPFQHAGTHRLAIALGDVAVQPEDDGLARRRALGRRVGLLQPPARDVVHTRLHGQVACEVGVRLGEMAQARVGRARPHRLAGQGEEVVDQVHEEAAGVRQDGRWGRPRRRARTCGRWRQHRNARYRVMLAHVHRREPVGLAHALDLRIRTIQRVAQAEGRLDRTAIAGDVAQQEARVHQHRLVLRMRRTGQRQRGEQAVGIALAYGAGQGRVTIGPHGGVQRDELQAIAHTTPLHQPVAPHLARVQAALAHRAGDVDAQQERLAQPRRGEFDPDLVVATPGGQVTLLAGGPLDDLGKGLRASRGRARCGR
jgi:hypothetical protein